MLAAHPLITWLQFLSLAPFPGSHDGSERFCFVFLPDLPRSSLSTFSCEGGDEAVAPDQQMKEQETNHGGLVADLAFHGVLPAEAVVEATVINRYKR